MPKSKVFPLFQQLGEYELSLRENLLILEQQHQIFVHLLAFKQSFTCSINEADLHLAESKTNKSQNIFNPESLTVDDKNMKFITKSDYSKHADIGLEFQGFCIVTFVERNGLSRKSDLSLGVLKYKSKYYSFSSGDCLQTFIKNPEKYLTAINMISTQFPWSIRLLNISSKLRILSLPARIVEKPEPTENDELQWNEKRGAKSANAGVGTSEHSMESHIDHNYRWNEWDMRRDALTYANLRNKKTTSAQTNKSHYKRDNTTQDYLKFPLKDGTMPGTSTQTRRDASTSM
eukprot:UN07042